MIAGTSSLTKLPVGRGLGLAKSSISATPLRVVDVHGSIPNVLANNASHRRVAAYMPKLVISDGTSIILTFQNFAINGAIYELVPGNTLTIEEMAIIGPNGTSIAPVTFSGLRSTTLTDGQAELRSDPVAAASLGLSNFSMQGTLVWIKALYSVPANGNNICQGTQGTGDYAGSQAGWYTSPATTLSTTDAAGPYIVTGTALVGTTPPMPIIIGQRSADNLTTHRSVYVQGDSISVGSTDFANSLYGTGYIARGLSNYGKNPIPMIRYGRGGITIQNFNASTRGSSYLQYCNTVIEELGTNNISADSLATITAELTISLARYASYKIADVIRMDLFPNASSTDSWATLANQTVSTHWGAGGKVDQLYAWINTQVGVPGGYTRRINLNFCRGNETVGHADWYKWKPTYAADQTHPSSTAAIAAGETMRLQLRDNIPFTLDEVGDIVLLYDTSIQSSVLDANGVAANGGGFLGSVASLRDQSSGNYHAAQSTAGDRPAFGGRTINGVTALEFDGTNDDMALSTFGINVTNLGHTVIAVFTPDTTAVGYLICSNGSNFDRFQVGNQYMRLGGTALQVGSPTSGTPLLQVARGTWDRQRLKINADAELAGTTTRGGVGTAFNLGQFPGGAGNLDGTLAYLLVINRNRAGPLINKIIASVILPGPFGAAVSWSDVVY